VLLERSKIAEDRVALPTEVLLHSAEESNDPEEIAALSCETAFVPEEAPAPPVAEAIHSEDEVVEPWNAVQFSEGLVTVPEASIPANCGAQELEFCK